MNYQTLLVQQRGSSLYLTLNRPHTRNAMNLLMVEELQQIFSGLTNDTNIRALILRGAEQHFCAGGDIKDMANARHRANQEHNSRAFYELNRRFGDMISQANHLPQVVICLLEGAVLGGGLGLACVCDLAITLPDSVFGLPETSLGVLPAQIAPFVVQRIGLTQTRRLALLGQRINGEEAVTLGIAQLLCRSTQEMEQRLEQCLEQLSRCAPKANAATKALLHKTAHMKMDDLLDQAAEAFAQAVSGEEGIEGSLAFMEKRKPNWAN